MKRPPRIVAASIAGHLFRLLPYRHRLKAALAMGRFVPFAARYRAPFETEEDARARVMLRVLAYANVPFANDIVVRGAEQLQAPAVIVSAHLFLNALLMRTLTESGHRLAIVRATPADPPYLAGSSIPLENLLISPTIFVRLRRRLASGEIAVLYVDGPPRTTRWQACGQYLSDATLRFAQRIDVPLFFAATRIDGGALIAEVRRPSGATVEDAMEELKDFLTVAERR